SLSRSTWPANRLPTFVIMVGPRDRPSPSCEGRCRGSDSRRAPCCTSTGFERLQRRTSHCVPPAGYYTSIQLALGVLVTTYCDREVACQPVADGPANAAAGVFLRDADGARALAEPFQ